MDRPTKEEVWIADQGVALLKFSQRQLLNENTAGEQGNTVSELTAANPDDIRELFQQTHMYVNMLKELLPMRRRLAELGRQLEKEGAIQLATGEDYAKAALAWVTRDI